MQYFKPDGPYFAGDCMPFCHDGVFHLYYLLDENHHHGKGGLGGHQWAHTSTTDLVHWVHHPLALGITEEWEGSICTGSVIFHAGLYHAFYATRRPDWTQHLSHAISEDGVHFQKTQPNPLALPPQDFSPYHFRDPFVFEQPAGCFNLLVTAQIQNYPLEKRGGCLVHLTSVNLVDWVDAGVYIIPGGEPEYGSIPECPDYFYWNGWYYLIFGLNGQTCYRMAHTPAGPWLRPAVDTLGNGLLGVMKTAAFGPNRRIGAGWIGTRQDDRVDGGIQWGGHTVFREINQLPDGSLGTSFPAEMMPTASTPLNLPFTSLLPGVVRDTDAVRIDAMETQAVGFFAGLPTNFRLSCLVSSTAIPARFGLGLRGEGNYAHKVDLAFLPHRQQVTLAQESIHCVTGLERPFLLDVVVKADIIDACVAGSRCIINRLPGLPGDRLFFFCENGKVEFDQLVIRSLESSEVV
jgi:hypothetical protein